MTLNKLKAQTVTLLKTTTLESYPSASGIEYFNGKLYIMGDDATHLLLLDTAHTPVDSVTISSHNSKRIHYTIKPDLESLTIGRYKKDIYLVAIPSFSSENRNSLYLFPLNNVKQYRTFTTPAPITQLKKIGIVEPNLEGSAILKKQVVISNRANLSQPLNYLVNVPIKKRSLKKASKWRRTSINLPASNNTIGISGLEYWSDTDFLLFTASTEATSSATADGEIGESYLGYFTKFSNRAKNPSISPDALINLSKELKIGNQKIEGICVESQTANSMILHLVTDNDNGQSILYKVQLTL
ncbi:MAG TPA: hypothetical protein VD794_06630 [Flavisolibacter sp.]|nr:hypothetical protein [Flavisolibacter sp.]